MEDRSQRFGPVAGILFAVLFYLGVVLTGTPPEAKAPGDEVLSFYADATKFHISTVLLLIMTVLFLFFAGALFTRLKRAETGALPSAAFGGAVVHAVGLAIFGVTDLALINASDIGDPVVARTLNILGRFSFVPAIVGLATLVLATGWQSVSNRAFPAWLGWVSVVLGLLALAGPFGLVAFILFPLWVIVVAVVMLRRGQANAAAV